MTNAPRNPVITEDAAVLESFGWPDIKTDVQAIRALPAKRNLTFSTAKKLLLDFACWLTGHQPVAGECGHYCLRCWRYSSD